MNKEGKTVLKKTVKIAGVTCFALGGAALIASGAALKALAEGAKFTRDSVKKILEEKPREEAAEVAEAEAVSPEETVPEETVEVVETRETVEEAK